MCWLLHVGVRVVTKKISKTHLLWQAMGCVTFNPMYISRKLLALFNQPQVVSKKFVIQQPFPMINPSFPMKIDQTRKFSALVIVPYLKITPRSCKNNFIQSPLSWLCKKKCILPWTQMTLVLIGKGLDIHLFLRLIPSQLPTFQPPLKASSWVPRRPTDGNKIHVSCQKCPVDTCIVICLHIMYVDQTKNYIHIVCVRLEKSESVSTASCGGSRFIEIEVKCVLNLYT